MKTYTFWKDNRKDQEYKLTLDELKEKYLTYLQKKDPEWVLYYGHSSVWSFVSADDGLRSYAEQQTLIALEIELIDVRHKLPCYN